MRLTSLIFLFSFCLLNLFSVSYSFAKEVPNLTGPIIDEVGILSDSFKDSLSPLLIALNNQTGIQFQLYFFDQLEDETIETYSIKVADKWRVGGEKEDKGLIFLLALRDKKMRLEIGQGLEGEITDLHAKRILDSLRPYLKQADYEEATKALVANVFSKLGVDPEMFKTLTPTPVRKNKVSGGGTLIIFMLFILLAIIQRFLPVSGNRYHGRRRPFDVYPGGGFGNGGHGGSSGGGWSGGGGGFSGGGASGDW